MANWCSESETDCRKHPTEKPHPGVCPSCLRERLTNFSNNIINFSSSNSASSFSSSPRRVYNYIFNHSSGSSPSAGNSPPAHRRPHTRAASDILDSIYLAISGSRCNSSNGLRKSRSVAFAPRSINGNYGVRDCDHGNGIMMNRKKQKNNNKKKKGGFWSKFLLRSSSNKFS